MLSPQILAFAFTLAPSLVSGALFSKDSLVKEIDANGFKKAMKANVGLVDFSWRTDTDHLFRKQVWWLLLHLGVVYVLNRFNIA